MHIKTIFIYIRKILLNKYSITLAIFIVYMLFFDDNNWIKRHQRSQNIKQLEKEYEHYVDEMATNQELVDKLNNDTSFLEKYAREHYYMKRPNEDVFILK